MSDSQEQFWSDNPNAPKIPYSLYLKEKTDLAGILVAAILYGILIVVFFQCMAALFSPANRKREGVKWGLVSYTVLMFSFVTVLGGTGLHVESVSYIDNRGFPGGEGVPPGPPGYRLSRRSGGTVVAIMFFFNNWLADSLLLYRCYTVYFANIWAIAPPFLVYLGSMATGLLSISLKGAEARRRFYTVNVSVSLSLNILLTLMIVVRLVLHGRNVRTATGSAGGISGLYKAIATMLIESCALFAVGSLLVIVPLFTDSPAANGFQPIFAELQVIAPLLIIRRIANKSALTSDTINPGSIGSFKARTREELTGSSVDISGGDPGSFVGEREMDSGELGVETVIDLHRDSDV